MAQRSVAIDAYGNGGTLLAVGTNQVANYSNFQTLTPGVLSFGDDNQDLEWDFAENAGATFQPSGNPLDSPATLIATGTVTSGITLPLLGTVGLGSSVNTAVFNAAGGQYVRFFNADGTDADPALLLDGVLSQITASPLLGSVLSILGVTDIVAYVEANLLLTYNLSSANGMAVICFAADTLICTRQGHLRACDIKIGTEVLTLDNGYQPVRWRGQRTISTARLIGEPRLRPIRFAAGSLGEGMPVRPMLLSPQHRCLIRSAVAFNMTGSREVLAPAKHLTGWPGISVCDDLNPVTYVHLLFDQHELVFSDGAVTESLFLGPMALEAFDGPARTEIEALFPDFLAADAAESPAPARLCLNGRQSRKLVARSIKNHRRLVDAAPDLHLRETV